MNRTLRLALSCGLVLLPVLALGCGGSDSSTETAIRADDPYAGDRAASGADLSGGESRVALVDRGLQMEIGLFAVPEGWDVVQDLATDPATGQSRSHTLDFRGPNGELIRSLGVANYGPMAGTSLDEAWQQAAMRGLQGDVEGLELGGLQPSRTVEASPGYARLLPKAAQNNFRVEGLEAPVRGRLGGRPVEGFVYLTRFSSDQMPDMGTLQVSALLSPPERLQATLRAEQQIAASFQPNPQHQQRMEQIGQMASQQSAAQHRATMDMIDGNTRAMTQGHEQRMANSRAQFNAHQQQMQGRWDANDASNAAWRSGQASSDEQHRRSMQGIRGTTDVYDAQTGTVYYDVPDPDL